MIKKRGRSNSLGVSDSALNVEAGGGRGGQLHPPPQLHPPHAGSGFRVQGTGFMVQGSGFRVQGPGSRIQGSGFRVQSAGLRLQGVGCGVC